ncbi:alpha/beta fold hydrolase [Anaerolineae bacterium CFX9]|nr:alpha/beta fold hydrolase [Anaerolineae bacterium CFX9]
MRRVLLVVASIIVSAAFLYLALRDVDLAQVWASIQQVDPGWLLVSFAMVFGAITTRAVRWRVLLGDVPPLWNTFHVYNIGTFINQLPLRVGEVARAVLISRDGVPVVTALTSVLVERLIDLVVVAVLIAYGLSQLPETIPAAASAALLLGSGAVGGFIMLLVLARFPTQTSRLLGRLEARLPLLGRVNLKRRLTELLAALRPLTQPRSAAAVFLTTFIGWAFSLATFAALLRAFAIDSVNVWDASSLGIGLVAFGIAVPVTVAGIGPTQGAVRLTGDALALDTVTSSALGLVFHAVTVLTYTLWGVIGLIALGVALSDLLRRAEKPQTGKTLLEHNRISLPTGAALQYESVYLGTRPQPEALIALHGWLGTGRTHFGDLLEWLGATYHVYAPTRRGYGESLPKPRDYPPEGFYERDACDILAFMDALGIDKAHILGWSDGGEIALYLAGIAPERFLSAAVWGAVGGFDETIRGAVEEKYPPTWLDDAAKRLHHLDDDAADRLVRGWVDAMRGYLDRGGDVSLSLAPRITCPLLLMLGEQETLNPRHLGQRFVDACPNARLQMFPTGHDIHWDLPEDFRQALSAFYREVREKRLR